MFSRNSFLYFAAPIMTGATLLATNMPSYAVQIGTFDIIFEEFNGELDSFDLDIGSEILPTGTISYSLDPNADPTQQFTQINFDESTASLELDLLVSFPLLDFLGESPLEIHISESGPVIGIPEQIPEIGESITFDFTTQLTGGGIFDAPGSIFDGFEFMNLNIHQHNETTIINNGNNNDTDVDNDNDTDNDTDLDIDVEVNTGVDVDVDVQDGVINDSNGNEVGQTQGMGQGSPSGTRQVPEPLTVLGSALTLGGGFLLKKIKAKKAS